MEHNSDDFFRLTMLSLAAKLDLLSFISRLDLSANEKLLLTAIARQSTEDGYCFIKSLDLMYCTSIQNRPTFSKIRAGLIEKKLINFELDKVRNRGIYNLNFDNLRNFKLRIPVQNEKRCVTKSYAGQNITVTKSYASPQNAPIFCSKNSQLQDKSVYGEGGDLGGDGVLDNQFTNSINNLDNNINNKYIIGANSEKSANSTTQLAEKSANSKQTNKQKKRKGRKYKYESNHPFFDQFYESYPSPKNRVEAMKAFEDINPDQLLFDEMMEAIKLQAKEKSIQAEYGMFVESWPHPSRWLSKARWKDKVNLNPQPTNDKQRQAKEDYQTRQRIAREMEELKNQPEPQPKPQPQENYAYDPDAEAIFSEFS